VDGYIPEIDLGIYLVLTPPFIGLLAIPALHLLCPDQSASLLVDAMVCPQSQASVLAGPAGCRGCQSSRAGRPEPMPSCLEPWLWVGSTLPLAPFMPTLQNNWEAYWWSLIALLPLTGDRGVGAASPLARRRQRT